MDLKHAVFYNLMIDRFSRGTELDAEDWKCEGSRFCGGTLRGIIERLGYLKELGADALLLTPFNKGVEYHGYHTTDLFSVDPRFGSLDDLRNLVGKAHVMGMKVIMDWTVNHVSSQHPYFVKASHDHNSEYRKWFHFTGRGDEHLSFLDVTDLPKLNLEHPPVREHVFEATKFWLKQGFDGLRMDHVIGVSHSFWEEFRAMVKRESPDAILIGEAVKNRISWTELPTLRMRFKFLAFLLSLLGFSSNEILIRQYVKHFDAMLDFRFWDIVASQVIRRKRPRIRFARLLLKLHYRLYPKDYPLIALVDNPDQNRLIFECEQDWEKVKQVARLQFAQDKPVNIFYGSEAGLAQDVPRTRIEYSDLDIRRPMPWTSINQEMFDFYKSLIAERKK